MFKSRYILEVKGAEDRIYRFDCSPDSPRGECFDVLTTMIGIIAEQIKEAAAVKETKEEKPKEEESKEGEEKDGAESKV